MRVFHSADKIRSYLNSGSRNDRKVGLVPTMGALHDGHLSLIRYAQQENDLTVVSIYVNPTQFNDESDLKHYPRTLEQDLNSLKTLDVDIVFMPNDSEVYISEPKLSFDFGAMGRIMEGEFRPGHFNGVALVISKLFNLLGPNKAYFGLKDLQQFVIIKHLVKDLSFTTEVVGVPTYREESGLAMSSRNQRLSEEGKESASRIYQALQLVRKKLEDEGTVEKAIEQGKNFLDEAEDIRLEYLEVVEAESLEKVDNINLNTKVAVCVAAYVEEIRLIDNIIFDSVGELC